MSSAMKTLSIALVGDRRETVPAHRCIPHTLELAAAAIGRNVMGTWVHTTALAKGPEPLLGFTGVWLVPGSPYASTDGALHAVRHARERQIPFLGTCGGFQHAIVELARNVAQLPAADHAESNAETLVPVISALSCGLIEEGGYVNLVPGSRLQQACQTNRMHETYHCRFGVNPAYRELLERAGLRFTAFDDAGDIRGGELPNHPFFIGTLFQPERSAERGAHHPLIAAFASAAGRI